MGVAFESGPGSTGAVVLPPTLAGISMIAGPGDITAPPLPPGATTGPGPNCPLIPGLSELGGPPRNPMVPMGRGIPGGGEKSPFTIKPEDPVAPPASPSSSVSKPIIGGVRLP